MKDKQARALAIVALVFMGIFVGSLIATLVDRTLLHGSIGYIALCSGVFVFIIFIALKADGRGYSISKMNNEIEMEKIEKALAEQAEREKEQTDEPNGDARSAEPPADGTEADNAIDRSEADNEPDRTDAPKE